MNKSDIAQALADRMRINKSQAEQMIETLTAIITDTVARGGNVTLTGFGEFSARVRKGRIGVNPQDPAKPIDIPSVPVPKFKAGSRLKKAVKDGALAGGAPGATAPVPAIATPSAVTPMTTPTQATHEPPQALSPSP